ncbi:hypothetical protein [Prosthecobacter sp.]|uniref:hypothetical protein n=1 Tax=Prosthecobacter sp. TaxID=1965333 RepID=UPI0037849E08
MASQTWQVVDEESGRVVETIGCVAASVKLAGVLLTQNNAVVTCAATTGLWPGMVLVGKGITNGTTVATVDTATTFTMSAVATATVNAPGVQVVARSYIPYRFDGTVATVDLNIEPYRDLFGGSTAFSVTAGGNDSPGNGNAMEGAGVYITAPTRGVVNSGGGTVSVLTGTLNAAVDDRLTHTAPRQQKQTVTVVHFILDDGNVLPKRWSASLGLSRVS